MATGTIIRQLRREKHLSQTDLAKILHVSQATVTSWETCRADPSSSALNSLANYFRVSTDYLLGRTTRRTEAPLNDLDDMLNNAESFDGKPINEHDREIIKAYLEGHFGK